MHSCRFDCRLTFLRICLLCVNQPQWHPLRTRPRSSPLTRSQLESSQYNPFLAVASILPRLFCLTCRRGCFWFGKADLHAVTIGLEGSESALSATHYQELQGRFPPKFGGKEADTDTRVLRRIRRATASEAATDACSVERKRALPGLCPRTRAKLSTSLRNGQAGFSSPLRQCDQFVERRLNVLDRLSERFTRSTTSLDL